MTRFTTTIVILLALAALLLSGCGGSGNNTAASGTSGTRKGKARFSIKWPAPVPTRLIPLASNCIKVTMTDPSGFSATMQSPRPASGNVSVLEFDALPTDTLIVTAAAYPNSDGTGVAQAKGQTTCTPQAGQTVAATLTMNTTITSVKITSTVGNVLNMNIGLPPLIIGYPLQLMATAYDAQNDIVLVPPTGAFAWSCNTAVASVDASGLLKGLSVSSDCTIMATENESQVSGTAVTNIGGVIATSPAGPQAMYIALNDMYPPNPADPPYNPATFDTLFTTNYATNQLTVQTAMYWNNLPSVNAPDTITPDGTVPAGQAPSGVAVNPLLDIPAAVAYPKNTGRVYVTNPTSNTVSVIDWYGSRIFDSIVVGPNPGAVAVNASTSMVYVANTGNNSVSVINGANDSIVATIPVGTNPSSIAVNSATNAVYVTNSGSNSLSVINGNTNTVVTTVPVGANPSSVDIDNSNNANYIYVANTSSNTVSVIDGLRYAVVATLSVGQSPRGVAVCSKSHRIFVTNSQDNTMSVFDGTTNTLMGVVPVGTKPIGIAVSRATFDVYVVNSGDNTVSIIWGLNS